MEKATQKQKDFIEDLSVKYQKTCPDLKDLSIEDADIWIKDILHNGNEDPGVIKVPFNPVQYGLCLKLVYQKWIYNGIDALDQKEKFIKEVKDTYILFEFK